MIIVIGRTVAGAIVQESVGTVVNVSVVPIVVCVAEMVVVGGFVVVFVVSGGTVGPLQHKIKKTFYQVQRSKIYSLQNPRQTGRERR